ncbi:hypothetical protein PENTCL1PPCAC_8797, partial [Pristionchus entomophagus]
KIFTAIFSPPDQIKVSYLRNMLWGEKCLDTAGLFSREIDGVEFIYRVCDDPEKDGIRVGFSELKKMDLQCIYRGKAIYAVRKWSKSPSVRYFRENIIVVELPLASGWETFGYSMGTILSGGTPPQCIFSSFGNDSFTFFYIISHQKSKILYTLNMETLEFVRPLPIEFEYCFLERVHNAIIYLRVFEPERWMSSMLPEGHFKKSIPKSKLRPDTADVRDKQKLLLAKSELSSSKFANEFTINKILGVGGFGIVFEAVNSFDNWTYAVKRISVTSNMETEALKEAQAMAKFNHPGIVGYNHTWVEKLPEELQKDIDATMLAHIKSNLSMSYRGVFIYIQMQLCKYSLSEWLAGNKTEHSRSIPKMRTWFKQVVSAVAYIHNLNLIHRDLKPSNILFSDKDTLKLCDLGIATERSVDDRTETALLRTNIGTMLP